MRPTAPVRVAVEHRVSENQPAKTDKPEKPVSALALPGRYAAQSLGNTGKAFMLPAVLGALLPLPLRPIALIPAGMTYAHLRQHPGAISFRPTPDTRHSMVAASIGLAPFLPAFVLQAHLFANHNHPVGAAISTGWKQFCSALPGAINRAMLKYPVNFVLGRLVAQAGASLVGAVGAHTYLQHTTGAQLAQRQPPHAAGPAGSQRMHPSPYLAAAALFTIPAALATPGGMAVISKIPLKSPAYAAAVSTAIVTSAIVGAAIGTAAVAAAAAPSAPADAGSDQTS